MTKASDVSSSGTKKIVTKGFNPIPVDLVEELRDGKLLEKKNNDEAPVITERDVAALQEELGLDKSLLIRAPRPEERLDWGSENWTTLGVDYLKLFPCIPLPPLILEICRFYDLAPSQLMPMVWSVVLSLEAITKDWDKKVSLAELLTSYSFGRKSSGLFTLTRLEGDTLIITPWDSVRRWKRRFVVVHKRCLVPDGGPLRTEWNNLCKYMFSCSGFWFWSLVSGNVSRVLCLFSLVFGLVFLSLS